MMKPERFPLTVSAEGVSAKIRKFTRIKNGETYTTFAAEYFLLGKRKQEWRSKFEDAKTAALNACRTISRGPLIGFGTCRPSLTASRAVSTCGFRTSLRRWFLNTFPDSSSLSGRAKTTATGLDFSTDSVYCAGI
jgi:hypothetical protein